MPRLAKAQQLSIQGTEKLLHVFHGHVLVVTDLGLGGGRENGLLQLLEADQPWKLLRN